EEGEQVDSAYSGGIMSAIGARNSGARGSTLGGGASNSYRSTVASLSTVVEEGEQVDSAYSGGIMSAIGARNSGARGSTLGGGASNSSNIG
nr:hypothetical protein [Tanacetum cinerariifolium]